MTETTLLHLLSREIKAGQGINDHLTSLVRPGLKQNYGNQTQSAGTSPSSSSTRLLLVKHLYLRTEKKKKSGTNRDLFIGVNCANEYGYNSILICSPRASATALEYNKMIILASS